ncbi:MAG: hypothetical protein ACUVSA_09825 [Desulfosoma sp.]|uniref:hypothetical protein n=1 Tax=Desulfosoma sp. TaxID=2603217 RepID=UPI004049F2F5
MSPHEPSEHETQRSEGARCHCPMCRMMDAVAGAKVPGKSFWDHLTNARIEVLRAVRSLIDERIDHLEKKKSDKGHEKKATPISVE